MAIRRKLLTALTALGVFALSACGARPPSAAEIAPLRDELMAAKASLSTDAAGYAFVRRALAQARDDGRLASLPAPAQQSLVDAHVALGAVEAASRSLATAPAGEEARKASRELSARRIEAQLAVDAALTALAAR